MADYNLQGVIRLKDQTREATDSASKGVEGLGKTISAAKAALTAFGVVEAAKAAKELGELGAEAERTERSFGVISGGAQEAEANLDAMIAATSGAIDRTNAMNVANQMMQMGLANNAEELGRNAEMATRLGRAMGVDALTAMDNWNLMLANQSIPRLDTFGISSGRVRTRINELMAATEGLTREQAFQTAVMEEGQKAMARLGDEVEDNALKIEQSKAAMQDLRVEAGKLFSDLVGGSSQINATFMRTAADMLRTINEIGTAFERNRFLVGLLSGDLSRTVPVLIDVGRRNRELAKQQRRVGTETARMTGQAEAYLDAQQETRTATDSASQAANAYRDSIRDLEQASADGAGVQYELAAAEDAAREAAARAETHFLNTAAALGEMSKAALARQELELLRGELERGTISQQEYRDATGAVLTQFGLLTEVEQEAQGDLDALRQAFVNGAIDADEYASAVQRIKERVDSLQDREITVRVNYDVPPMPSIPGSGGGPDDDNNRYATAAGFEGWVTEPTRFLAGEAGPEYVSVRPSAQAKSVTNNFNMNFPEATNVGPAIQMMRALYGVD